jgi:hypothetical protein
MKIFNQIIALALAAALLPVSSADAADKGPEFGFKANAGYQYDSNVNLAEIDENTGEADNALLLSAGAKVSLPIAGGLSASFAYDYAQTSYKEFSQFDLALHHGMAELALDIAGFNTAVTLDRFDARVDRQHFLDITQVSPSVARLFGESFYLRGAYTRAEKGYADAGARDATNDAVRADAYVLFDGMNRYLSAGYRVDSEDAVDGELDYDGNRAMLAYGHRVELGRLPLDLKTSLQYENRDYVNVTEAIGVMRNDKRLRVGISADLQLTEYFGINGEFQYSDNRSNLAAANFDENVYSLNLSVEF